MSLMNQWRAADTFLLGRVTYELWEHFWPAARANPSSTELDRWFANYVEDVEKVVLSRTRVINDNVAEESGPSREGKPSVQEPEAAAQIEVCQDEDARLTDRRIDV